MAPNRAKIPVAHVNSGLPPEKRMRTRLRNEQIWLATVSLMILATVALAGALAYTRPVMVPFVLAIFITTMAAPLVDYQVIRWQFPRPVAISLVILLVLGILAVLGLLLILALQTVVSTVGDYSENFGNMTSNLLTPALGKIDLAAKRKGVSP